MKARPGTRPAQPSCPCLTQTTSKARWAVPGRPKARSTSMLNTLYTMMDGLVKKADIIVRSNAVSELGPEDSGRNIVEIIFKSSWLKKENPICKIERILKVHNTQRTIQRFEDCRDVVKLRANNNMKKNPRCAADGNELLRFHCTTLTCSLGACSTSNLCCSIPACGVCTIIRHGFQGNKGVRTTASSGRAHDSLACADGRRAMLVCRVIAGRVKPNANEAPSEEEILSTEMPHGGGGSYDSVAGSAGLYSNLEDLVVYNARAILPCFVVIYKSLNVI